MSVQERIRALNLKNEAAASGNALPSPISPIKVGQNPPQLNLDDANTNNPSSPKQSLSTEYLQTKSPLSSPSSEKAQLFKAAKLIQKSFDNTETDIAQHLMQPSSPRNNTEESLAQDVSKKSIEEEEEDNMNACDSEEMIDASTALKFWKTKGITKDGPRSYKDALKDKGGIDDSAIDVSTSHQQGGELRISGEVQTEEVQSVDETTDTKPPSPPDIIRTANAESDMKKDVKNQDENDNTFSDDGKQLQIHNGDEDADDTSNNSQHDRKMPPHSKSVTIDESNDLTKGHTRSSSANSTGAPYRAFGRRSRLRSPRGTSNTLSDHLNDNDGAQSVVSAYSTSSQTTSMSQVSTLSSRANKFVKGKKDKRKGSAPFTAGGGSGDAKSVPGVSSSSKPDVFAKDIAYNILRGKAYNNDRIKQRAADATAAVAANNDPSNRGDSKLKKDSPFDEQNRKWTGGRPQTIDLVPKMDGGGHSSISGLKRDIVELQQYHTMDTAVKGKSRDSMQTSAPVKGRVSSGQSYSDNTPSLDDTSTNYSELKAKDLFDVTQQEQNDIKIQPASILPTQSENADFDAFPGGKSFDTGCQVFEALNPLIDSACNAISSGGHATNRMFSKSGKAVSEGLCQDAPSDEDVAIEVEYVDQQGDQGQESVAGTVDETSTVFSVSTRESYA